LIEMSGGGNELEILVSDNGSGVETGAAVDAAPDKSKRIGHGLVNMRERLRGIGGRCEIKSEVKKGTTIRFLMPLDGRGV